MSLTMKDFRQMVQTSTAAAGLHKRSGVSSKLLNVYGVGFKTCLYEDNGAHVLTPAGVDEYNNVQAWISGGCKTALKSVHSCALVGRQKACHRKIPLFKITKLAAKVDTVIGVEERQSLRAIARIHAEPYAAPQEQFKKIQQTNVSMFLRSMLLQIANNPKTPGDIQQYIAEGLLACQAELQILVNI